MSLFFGFFACLVFTLNILCVLFVSLFAGLLLRGHLLCLGDSIEWHVFFTSPSLDDWNLYYNTHVISYKKSHKQNKTKTKTYKNYQNKTKGLTPKSPILFSPAIAQVLYYCLVFMEKDMVT